MQAAEFPSSAESREGFESPRGHQSGRDLSGALTAPGGSRGVSDSPLAGLPLFDAAAGAALRDRGLALVEISNAEFVSRMREEAVRIARDRGEVHVDDLRFVASKLGIAPASSQAWGAIFSERNRWVITGYRASAWVTNHGHRSPVRVLARAA